MATADERLLGRVHDDVPEPIPTQTLLPAQLGQFYEAPLEAPAGSVNGWRLHHVSHVGLNAYVTPDGVLRAVPAVAGVFEIDIAVDIGDVDFDGNPIFYARVMELEVQA